MDEGKTEGTTMPLIPILLRAPTQTMGHTQRSQMQTMQKILQGKKSERTSRLSRKSRTYTMLLPCLTTPTNSHPSWHMEGADVLDTKIFY